MLLPWGQKVSAEFRARLLLGCENFGWTTQQAGELMGCMAFESGETFSPAIKNAAGSGATGLIQFMRPTAIVLNTTVDQLADMSAEDQLAFVFLYFQPYHTRVHCLADMYMAILLPKYVNASADAVLFSSGTAYRQNSGLDANSDGKITKAEAAGRVQAKYDKGLRPPYVFDMG